MPELTEILAPVIGALEADGYEPTVNTRDGVVSFAIAAGPDACEECLSPPEILKSTIAHLLDENGVSGDIELHYPPGWTGGAEH